MGLAALTRKGWKKNPREQGKFNLCAAILGLIVGNIISYFVSGDILSVEMNLFILGWGVISYFAGICLEYSRGK